MRDWGPGAGRACLALASLTLLLQVSGAQLPPYSVAGACRLKALPCRAAAAAAARRRRRERCQQQVGRATSAAGATTRQGRLVATEHISAEPHARPLPLLRAAADVPNWYKCQCPAGERNCACPSIDPPGGLPPARTPQFILFTVRKRREAHNCRCRHCAPEGWAPALHARPLRPPRAGALLPPRRPTSPHRHRGTVPALPPALEHAHMLPPAYACALSSICSQCLPVTLPTLPCLYWLILAPRRPLFCLAARRRRRRHLNVRHARCDAQQDAPQRLPPHSHHVYHGGWWTRGRCKGASQPRHLLCWLAGHALPPVRQCCHCCPLWGRQPRLHASGDAKGPGPHAASRRTAPSHAVPTRYTHTT